MTKNRALVCQLTGRTDPSGQRLWSREMRLVPETANTSPRGLQGRSDLVRLCRDQERRILWSVCCLRRVERERGPYAVWRKSKIAVVGLAAATCSFLRIARMLSSQFSSAVTHQISERQSQLRETHTASNLGELLDVLAGPKSSPTRRPELKECPSNPFRSSCRSE
jgi:hypothetical protein